MYLEAVDFAIAELLEILEESDGSIIVPTRAGRRDERKASLRRKHQNRKAGKRSLSDKQRQEREERAQKTAVRRHERLHEVVSKIATSAELINTLGRGQEFDDNKELIDYLAANKVACSLRVEGSMATNQEIKTIRTALRFGEECGFVSVEMRPGNKRILVSLASSPAAILRCRCSEDVRLRECA
ncbi:MAG: hypothetical protein JWO07_857 [Candidatus Saccharibacteria bacterium]|nr:hypothetical protein [Candidatus Saccharibacteria bacterium]